MEHNKTTLDKVASFLRSSSHVSSAECILAEKRVDAFKGAMATTALLSKEFQVVARKNNFDFPTTAEDAAALLQQLSHSGYFLRVRSMNGSKFLQPELSKVWSDDALYAWLWEGSQTLLYVASFSLAIVAFSVILFPLWPFALRQKAGLLMNWAFYAIVGFLIFLVVISIIRTIIYNISRLRGHALWLFPNLWADCGFFESFQPVWQWEESANASERKDHLSDDDGDDDSNNESDSSLLESKVEEVFTSDQGEDSGEGLTFRKVDN